ncbi:MAG: protein kinase [Deltaproteobacteria bacterium]
MTEVPPASGVTTKVEQFGHYTLFGKIAAGGMASVYLGRLNGADEGWYAVKRVHPHLASRADVMQMFMNEAKILSRLGHQNICGITDYGIADGSPFLVMRYLHGAPLSGLLRRILDNKTPIPIDLMAYVVACTCEGLHYAHDATGEDGRALGLVHRDISPQNIFVTFSGEVKLLDFGVAKAAGFQSFTRTGHIKGKYAYMSPEQVEATPLDRRSDVFSLGIVLWEMMTGRHLFKRKREIDTLRAITRAVVPAASEVNGDVPQSLDAICAKALVAHKDRRYQNASDMGQALWAHLTAATNPMGSDEVAEIMLATFPDKPSPKQIAQVPTDPDIEALADDTDAAIDVVGAKTPRTGADAPDAAPTPHAGQPLPGSEPISWAEADLIGSESRTPSAGATLPHEAETPMPQGPNGTQRLPAVHRNDSETDPPRPRWPEEAAAPTDPPVPWASGLGVPSEAVRGGYAAGRPKERALGPSEARSENGGPSEAVRGTQSSEASSENRGPSAAVRGTDSSEASSEDGGPSEVIRGADAGGDTSSENEVPGRNDGPTIPIDSQRALSALSAPTEQEDNEDPTLGDPTLAAHVQEAVRALAEEDELPEVDYDDQTVRTEPLRSRPAVTMFDDPHVDDPIKLQPFGTDAQDTLMDDGTAGTSAAMVVTTIPRGEISEVPVEDVAGPEIEAPPDSVLDGAAPSRASPTVPASAPSKSRWLVAMLLLMMVSAVVAYVWVQTRPVETVSDDAPDTEDVALAQAGLLYREGNQQLAKGKVDAAKAKLLECVELADLPECHRSLGVIFAREDRTTESIRHYQRYVDLAPDANDAERVKALIRTRR